MKQYHFFLIILFVYSLSTKADSWGTAGNYDISWYNMAPDIYISSPSELAGVAYLTNNNFTNFSGQTIHFTTDIDLSDKTWVAIGSNESFKGKIEGHGFSILGIQNSKGFIASMEDGAISHMTLKASINTDTNLSGLLVASASNSTFLNISVEGDISYKNQYISTSTGWNTKIYNGGVVGYAKDCTFTDVVSNFTQSLIFGKNGGGSCYGYIMLYTGGIVGYGDGINKYIRCEGTSNYSNIIYGYVTEHYYTYSNATGIYCGGIVGYDSSSNSEFISCFGKITSHSGSHRTGTYDNVIFYISGFGYLKGRVKNCVAIVDSYNIAGRDYSWVSTGYHTSIYLYDCGEYKPSQIGGSFINNDTHKTTSKIGIHGKQFYSSSSYNKSQMNTQAFIDELNLYTKLYMNGEENWTIENGILTLKHTKYDHTSIKNVDMKSTISDDVIEYYNLEGVRVLPTIPGVYIRRQGRKANKVIIRDF